MKIHPDFDTIRDSDDFHNWAEEQPQWVQKRYMKMTMMQNQQQELLTSTRQIEISAEKRRARTVKVLLHRLKQKVKRYTYCRK